MNTYAKVRNFDGEYHPHVTKLDGTVVYLDPHREYLVLGTCVDTGLTVLSDEEIMLVIQSIDCEYGAGE